ncbi:hypothetical protein [Bacillus cereus]|uniref:hypothetical protein n=1 Tax=Bacillus cereus TaxID=1396 RepID=UPI000B4BE4D3|nr:hypothetical protein [Bacillus cereus]
MNGIIELVRKIDQIDSKIKEWFILMDSYQDEVYKLDITVGKEQLAVFGYEKGKRDTYVLLVNDFQTRINGALEERVNLLETLNYMLIKEGNKVDDMYKYINSTSNNDLAAMFISELTEKLILITNLTKISTNDFGKEIDKVRNERIEKLKLNQE